MQKITANATLPERLKTAESLLEVCDEQGRTLGFFQPMTPPRVSPDGVQSPFSIEELEERRQQRSGRPLKDILADFNRQ